MNTPITEIFSAQNIIFMLKGARVSILVALCSVFFGTIFGILAAICKISKNKALRIVGNIYVELIRGTPMLLQLTFFYLGVPTIYRMITGNYLSMDPLLTGIIALSINSGAYSCELIRGGINSIDKGQWEAGKSIGLTNSQIMRKIILPQSFKVIVPPLANELIVLIKDSSLVSTIGALELMKSSSILGTQYFNPVYPLMGAGVIYLVLTLVISKFTSIIERRMSESD